MVGRTELGVVSNGFEQVEGGCWGGGQVCGNCIGGKGKRGRVDGDRWGEGVYMVDSGFRYLVIRKRLICLGK